LLKKPIKPAKVVEFCFSLYIFKVFNFCQNDQKASKGRLPKLFYCST
jgi:hypothetical protein